MTKQLEHGTQVEFLQGLGRTERAVVLRRFPGKRKPIPPYPVAGYHCIQFADGGMLAVHEDALRVVV